MDKTHVLSTALLLRCGALGGLGRSLGRRAVQDVGRPLGDCGPGRVDGVVDGVLPRVRVVCGEVSLLSLAEVLVQVGLLGLELLMRRWTDGRSWRLLCLLGELGLWRLLLCWVWLWGAGWWDLGWMDRRLDARPELSPRMLRRAFLRK